jgi:hypothetical protein
VDFGVWTIRELVNDDLKRLRGFRLLLPIASGRASNALEKLMRALLL